MQRVGNVRLLVSSFGRLVASGAERARTCLLVAVCAAHELMVIKGASSTSLQLAQYGPLESYSWSA